MALEAFAASPSSIHPGVAEARPYEGLTAALGALREHLDGSALFAPGHARNLQDPLSFRNTAHVLGAARDALAFARRQVSIELNAAQGNPLVLVAEDRVISVANFEALPMASAMDALRLGLAPAVAASAERSGKLLEHLVGVAHRPDPAGQRHGPRDHGDRRSGHRGRGTFARAARLSRAQLRNAGGRDRGSSDHGAARREADLEMVALAQRVTAIELVVGAQAVELREGASSGRGTARTHSAVRKVVPFVSEGDHLAGGSRTRRGTGSVGPVLSRRLRAGPDP